VTRGIGDDDRVGVQVDEAKAWTLRLIQHVPLTIVVDVRTMGSFWTHWR